MKKSLVVFTLLFISFVCFAQSFQTAGEFFDAMSAKYASFKDYQADLVITAGSSVMNARSTYKAPEMLRLDFTEPKDQAIVFNGDTLTIYLPRRNVVLSQMVDPTNETGGASLATAQGLALMKRSYIISYETTPNPVEDPNGSGAMVIRLVLNRRGASEGFRRLVLSVSPDTLLIRSIEGYSAGRDLMKFQFSNYAVNQNIPDTRFLYDAPASANAYNNFLYND